MSASLCTSAAESGGTLCDPPKTPVSLTLPRADLLKRVEVPASDPVVTASTGAQNDEKTRPVDSESVAQGAAEPKPASSPAPEQPGATSTPAPEKTGAKDTAAPEKAVGPSKDADDKDHRALPKASPAPKTEEAKKEEPKPDEDARLIKDAEREAFRAAKVDPIAAVGRRGVPTVTNLREAVGQALSDHPLIGLANARVNEAQAAIGVASSALYPQLEGRAGGGHGVSGAYQNSDTSPFFSNKNHYGAGRGEASLSGRQLLFDFGATRSDVARSGAVYDSETLKQREQTDTVASQVTDIYLKILEQRELYTAAAENLTALEKISKLVEQNEKNGNGTVADLKRVRSRLIDAQSNLADAKSELQTGTDRFIRLVRYAPGALRQAPSLSRLIPATPEGAIAQIAKNNPRIQALEAALRASRHEIDTQKASVLPKVTFESDIAYKEYRSRTDKGELDAKGLVVLKYKFLDGGLHSNQLEQLNSRAIQAEMRLRNEMDDIEADLRKQYRILQSARSKSASLKDNVVTAEKARQLYDEQFRGGKRTLLELLDIQTTAYTAKRTAISNRYEEQRAVNSVLLNTGKLTQTLLTMR